MKVFVESTFSSCENNAYYTTQIYEFFSKNGFELTKDESDADFIVIVTCGFDKERKENALDIIKHYACNHLYKKKIIVTGCLPKIDYESVRIPGTIVISLNDLVKFNDIFKPEIKIEDIKSNIIKDGIRAILS